MAEENDQVKIMFGGDTEGVAAALRGIRGMAERALSPIKDYFNDTFKGMIGATGVERVIDSIREHFREVLEEAEQIKRVGESTGLGSEQWQKLAYNLREVGGTAEDGERSLSQLADLVGQAAAGAQSAKDVFDKWGLSIRDADGHIKPMGKILSEVTGRMDSLADPTLRVAMATEMLGRHSTTTVAALKKMASGGGITGEIISDRDIGALEKISAFFKDVMARSNAFWGHKMAVGYGNIFGWDKKPTPTAPANGQGFTPGNPEAARKYNELSAEAGRIWRGILDDQVQGQDRLANLERTRAQIAEDLGKAESESIKAGELKLQLAQKDKEIADEKLKLTEQTREMQDELNATAEQIAHQHRDAGESLHTPYTHTLQELAKSAQWIPGAGLQPGFWGGSPAAALAAQTLRAKQQVGDYTLTHGKDAQATSWEKQIQGWEKQLSDAGFTSPDHKLEDISEATGKMEQHLANLLDAANNKGIPVKPVNAK